LGSEMNEIFEKIAGQPCMRKEVGSMRSISLGFGDEASAINKRRNRHYRLWEFGAYSGDWKIAQGADVLLAKSHSSDVSDLDSKLQSISLGRFQSIQQLSKSAVRMNLDNGFAVEFFGDTDDDDEYFHVFCPENVYIEFSESGWQVGRSDVPWTA
jgi:glucan biosynthesis protein